ncbi:PSD1 and planctomycete cytochrome C domain-containing protein [Armatimonas sp.]|uniref:PSD1 and planctomycete cytochrome C domain-containing protein n=1 Tax=Armatimonas sp. TaxID=1872638 RepID=UPI003753866E
MKTLLSLLALAATLTAAAIQPPKPPSALEFNRDIRPILSSNCFYCHGPDVGKRQANLRLDQPNAATKSALLPRIFAAPDAGLMPPAESHKILTATQKEIVKRWIAQGATYQKHWAYEMPVKATIPAGQSPIDFLVQKRLTSKGLKLSPTASRRTLIRRLYTDLLGLPPTPAEVRAFESDKAPDAYAKLVERLLANPHYGERMAQGWLDVTRFADTIGYHSDNPRNIWPYRDYVINAFNANKRFDRFTREQIAGDLLPDASQETRIGSAFNRLLLTTEEGGAQPKDYEARYLTDRVRAVGATWLGQTTGCANCHDHKFDPLTQRDFFRLGAFFADIQEGIVAAREPGMVIATPEQEKQLATLKGAEKKAYEATLTHCLVSVSTDKKRIVRILPRGNFLDETGETVTAATPNFLPPLRGAGGGLGGRLDLANWLVARENPLTARTVMNRLWKQLFGSGISRVLDDLGAQGEPPTNPALLDWLACEFQDSGWDVKHMVRLLVRSNTYKQVSTASKALLAADPDNREVARQSRYRLDAELVRDNALAIAGLLSLKIGGPSVKPYQPDGYWDTLNFPTRKYATDKGESQYRRGLYVWWQRSFLHPSMLAFDAPSREECTAERSRSNIPQQALVLLNDPTYVEAARAFAIQVLQQPSEQRLTWAWQQALQRNPDATEQATLLALQDKHRARYKATPSAADEVLAVGLAPIPTNLDKPELAAWTLVCRVLLNLHETITRQ